MGVLRLVRTVHKLHDLMALGFLTLQITFQVSTAYIALLLATWYLVKLHAVQEKNKMATIVREGTSN